MLTASEKKIIAFVLLAFLAGWAFRAWDRTPAPVVEEIPASGQTPHPPSPDEQSR